VAWRSSRYAGILVVQRMCPHAVITVHGGAFTEVEVGGGGFVLGNDARELEVQVCYRVLGAGEGP
jgi:hypothetical protein